MGSSWPDRRSRRICASPNSGCRLGLDFENRVSWPNACKCRGARFVNRCNLYVSHFPAQMQPAQVFPVQISELLPFREINHSLRKVDDHPITTQVAQSQNVFIPRAKTQVMMKERTDHKIG